jgi:hypothetical protein
MAKDELINVGRRLSGGVFRGLFGNPVRERVVSEQYRVYFRGLMKTNKLEVDWLKAQLLGGTKLYCPGCGVGGKGCHCRIIEQELGV